MSVSDASSCSGSDAPFSDRNQNSGKDPKCIISKKYSTGRYLTETKTNFDNNENSLRADPQNIRFESINPGVLYAMTFSLRNATKSAQRIRIQAPKSDYFALNYIPSGTVAPGLDVRGEIECQIPAHCTDMFFTDQITATMGTQTVEIPLYACKPHADIRFNSLASIGCVAEGQFATVDVYFENVGQITGILKFKLSQQTCLKLSSLTIELAPRAKERVVISFEAKEVGPWREIVEIAIEGALSNTVLDVSAQVVDQKLTLLAQNNGGVLENLDFGSIFYGQKQCVSALLVNTGPQPLNFVVLYPEDDDANRPQSNEVMAGNQASDDVTPLQKRFIVSPAEGIIKPFSELTMMISFNPEINIPNKGFTRQFHTEATEAKVSCRKACIETLETGHKLFLLMQGVVSTPSVHITPTMLRFGNCPVNDRRDMLLSLTNKSSNVTAFSFSRLAQFKLFPSKGVLQPNETKSIVASFLPAQLGVFKTTVSMSIADGLANTELRIVADSDSIGAKKVLLGGSDKLPTNFQPAYKFVDPEEVQAYQREKQSKATSKTMSIPVVTNRLDAIKLVEKELQSSSSSRDRDAMYKLYQDDLSSASIVDGGVHPYQSKLENDRVYNDYIQQAHTQRVEEKRKLARDRLIARGGPDRESMFGVDMGMERGLDEPLLHVPMAAEPLWLMSNRSGDDSNANGRNRIPCDENRLINKKYPAAPSGQAEMRDCTCDLSGEDIKLVTPSHKILNFGRVCLNSIMVKNFVVTNDLSHSVMVKIDDLEPELKQSRPEGQVIPKLSLAGFDIHFCSKVLGKYKKTFAWIVNGRHSHKVTVVAEVVPIELGISKSHLIMEFPPELLETSVFQDIVLTNPGNAPAEFLWGSAGAFSCRPERGAIHPGQSTVITVQWKPAAGKRNEEELGLHITGGVDQTMRVEGVLKEAKAEFQEKKLMMGTVAVGMEKSMSVRLKNVGINTCTYFVNSLDEKYGVKVVPDKGFIQPGDTAILVVAVTARSPMSYNDLLVSAAVRGGKSVSFKIAGESIIPQFTLQTPQFRFGMVAVGSDFRVPFGITNNSAITACLTIDLTKYSDFRPILNGDDICANNSPVEHQVDAVGNKIDMLIKPGMTKATCNVWKFTIGGGSSLVAPYLLFTPTIPKIYAFRLPLQMLGITDDISLYREVHAEGTPSRLEVSSQFVDFGDRVVSRDPMSRATYFLEIFFKNVDIKKGFAYEIRDSPAAAKRAEAKAGNLAAAAEEDKMPTFFISPVRGDLAAGVSCPIRVTFMPHSSGEFEKRLEIYITDQPDKSRPYISLTCKGSGVYPRLTFSKQHVQLPTVPLGITTRNTFYIHNNGYANLDIKHRVSPTIPVPLVITFPEGSELSTTITKVKVVIAAKSDVSVSWTGKIEFYDADGDKFSITVCGCADNCVLTNYSFLKMYSDTYGFIGLDDQPIKSMRKTEILELRTQDARRKEALRKQRMAERTEKLKDKESTATIVSNDKQLKKKGSKSTKSMDMSIAMMESAPVDLFDISEGVDIDREAKEQVDLAFVDKEIKFLLKWLNKFVTRKPFDIERFPECITETNGDLFVDCVEQLSGRKIISLKQSGDSQDAGLGSPSPSKRDKHSSASSEGQVSAKMIAANRLAAKFQLILNSLTRSGALLNHVNPIALLNLEDHVLAQEFEIRKQEGTRTTATRLAALKQSWTDSWLIGCKLGWCEVLYQSLKVFMLSRVTYKDYVSMPGVLLTLKEEPAETKSKSSSAGQVKNKKSKIPAEFTGSNVYTQAESVILAWASYHLQRAANLRAGDVSDSDTAMTGSGAGGALFGLSKRVIDMELEFKDLFGFCQVFHSHLPESTKSDGPLAGYTTIDRNNKTELFNRLNQAFLNARLEFDMLEDEIALSARSIILMLLHLFLNLPNLIPKTKIEFKGLLGKPITKTIELRNPSKSRVMYEVTVHGDSGFSVEASQFIIPSESAAEFTVNLCARFSTPVSAILTFWSVRDGGVAGSTIVFQLVSAITGRCPVETIKRAVNVFEFDSFPLEIVNPFSVDCTVPVKLYFQHAFINVEDVIKGDAKKQRISKATAFTKINEITNGDDEDANKILSEDEDIERMYKQPIWCSDDVIQLPAGGSKTVTVNVLPFMLGTYSCQLVLSEPKQGEFCYDVIVDVGLPKAFERMEYNVLVSREGVSTVKALRLASKNFAFERALGLLSDIRLSNPSKKTRARVVLQNLLASPIVDEETGPSSFCVLVSSPYFSCVKPVLLVSEYGALQANAQTQQPARVASTTKYKKVSKSSVEAPTAVELANTAAVLNTCFLAFNPEKPGTYQTKVVLFSRDNKCDVRVLDVASSATMPDAKMMLEFRSACRQKLTQDIPIVNDSDKDLNLVALVTGRGFTGPKTLIVGRGDTATFPVSFVGQYVGSFDGTLQLRNQEGGDMFEYSLVGVAEDPLAEDHLQYRCKARAKHPCTINLQQIPTRPAKSAKSHVKSSTDKSEDTQRFAVVTDLPHVSGEAFIDVPVGGADYNFSICSPVGGRMTGSITFTEVETNAMIWFTVDVEVASPGAERTIDVEAVVRKAVVVEISLDNPLAEPLEFTISLEGEGLFGDERYCLPAKSSDASESLYELIYSPLVAAHHFGVIRFVNDKMGEFWYKLNLTATPAPPVVVDTIEAMIGTVNSTKIPLDNPLPESVTLHVQVSDSEHFQVFPDVITLKPYAQSTFQLNFRPSSLNDIVNADIKLIAHKSFGEMDYKVSGKGLLPGIMPVTHTFTALGETGSQSISFRNPFSHPLPVDIVLNEESLGQDPVFAILLKKYTDLVVAPKSTLVISLSFSPRRLGEFSALVQVRSVVAGRSLLWCFPVCGMAEAGVAQEFPRLMTACKSSIVRDMDLRLHGLCDDPANLHIAEFSVEVVADGKHKGLVDRAFRAQAIEVLEIPPDIQSSSSINSREQVALAPANLVIRYRLLFEPLRTFTTAVELVVVCKNKGRWRACLELESTDPEPDDKIQLTAPVGGLDKISFRLNNRFLGYSSFQAYFSARSSPHFSVTPSSGVLAPYGSEGTRFLVTYNPVEYGIIDSASLVIATEDAQWNYEVVGTYPDFNVSSLGIKSKVDSGFH